MLRMSILFAAPLTLLCACGGGAETDTSGVSAQGGAPRIVTVQDNGSEFTYTTTSNFQATPMSETELSGLEKQMFDAINAERAKGGKCYNPATGQTVENGKTTPLTLEKNIHTAAQAHAAAMAQNNFEGHINPFDAANRTPARRMVGAGYKPNAPLATSKEALFFEESLAYGYLTPAEVIAAWESESFNHCMTIFVPLTYGAVAVQDGLPNDKYVRYWVLNVSGKMPSGN